MINKKTLNLHVIAYDSMVELISYNMEPYMSTYWTELGGSIELMPYLPYLSQCSF
jgi:hypothetical protein